MRDYRKLTVFQFADSLVLEVYVKTKSLPNEEKYGLQSQIRRAAVSVTANMVEGSARKSLKDYLHFLNMAQASACEANYLLSVARRLEYVKSEELEARFDKLIAGLRALINSLERELS